MGKYVNIDVYVDELLDDITDYDLLEEVRNRGLELDTEFISSYDLEEFIKNIHQKRRTGMDYQRDLDELIYAVIGKIA